MAKGPGWMIAVGFAYLQNRLPDEDPKFRVCPVCGGVMEFDSMTRGFKCSSDAKEDMPDWLVTALKSQGHPKPWDVYHGYISVGRFILMTCSKGDVLAEFTPMNRGSGRFDGWQWWETVPFEDEYIYPDWFPFEERDAYVAKRFQEWQQELAVLVQHPDCGDFPKDHLVRAIKQIRSNIENAERVRLLKAQKEEKQNRAQEEVNKALELNGFFNGRLGLAVLPTGAIVVERKSFGSKSDPMLLIAASKLTFDQFERLVESLGDFSQVVYEGRTPKIVTPHPEIWIGRGGSTAKSLATALGLRFLRVEKK